MQIQGKQYNGPWRPTPADARQDQERVLAIWNDPKSTMKAAIDPQLVLHDALWSDAKEVKEAKEAEEEKDVDEAGDAQHGKLQEATDWDAQQRKLQEATDLGSSDDASMKAPLERPKAPQTSAAKELPRVPAAASRRVRGTTSSVSCGRASKTSSSFRKGLPYVSQSIYFLGGIPVPGRTTAVPMYYISCLSG